MNNKIIEHWISIYRLNIENAPSKLEGKTLERFIDKVNGYIMTLELLSMGIESRDGIYAIIMNLYERTKKADVMLSDDLDNEQRNFILTDISQTKSTIVELEGLFT